MHAERGEGLQVSLDARPPPLSEPAIVSATGKFGRFDMGTV